MDTISGLNAIKSVFAALGAKTSDSNYAVPLVDKTSAEPKGFMEMANLASVLGANYKSFGANDDLNNFTTAGCWFTDSSAIGSSLQHKPSGLTIGNFILQVKVTKSVVTQFFIVGNVVYIRSKYGSWTDWEQVSTNVPSFYKNYANISALATAVGGIEPVKSGNYNANETKENGMYFVLNGTNMPTTNGVLMVAKTGTYSPTGRVETRVIQFYFSLTSELHFRVGEDVSGSITWKDWKQVSTV